LSEIHIGQVVSHSLLEAAQRLRFSRRGAEGDRLRGEIGRGGGTRFETQAAGVLRGIERGAGHQVNDIGGGSVDYLTLVARILREQPPEPVPASPIIRP